MQFSFQSNLFIASLVLFIFIARPIDCVEPLYFLKLEGHQQTNQSELDARINLTTYVNTTLCMGEEELLKWVDMLNLSKESSLYLNELLEGMETILAVPIRVPEVMKKKEELQLIYSCLATRLPQEIVVEVLSQWVVDEKCLAPALALVSIHKPSLQCILHCLSSDVEERELILRYKDLIPNLSVQVLEAIHTSLIPPENNLFLAAMFLNYQTSQDLRNYIQNALSLSGERTHFLIAKHCLDSKEEGLLHVLFSLLPHKAKTKLEQQLSAGGHLYAPSLPGRLDSGKIYRAKMGSTELYFVMSLGKFNAINSFVEGLNKNTNFSIDFADAPKRKVKVLPECIKFVKPLGYNKHLLPIYADESGKEVIDQYLALAVRQLTDDLGLSIQSATSSIHLGLNHDSISWQKRVSIDDAALFPKKPDDLTPMALLEEFSLADWQMPKGTVAGILLEDSAEGESRFFIPLNPQELVNVCLIDGGSTPAKAVNYYALLSPIDYQSSMTSGSTKGKNLITTIKGIFPLCQLKSLQEKSSDIKLNNSHKNNDEIVYSNGIIIKKSGYTETLPESAAEWLGGRENTDIFKLNLASRADFIKHLSKIFNIQDSNLVQVDVYHLVKRSVGLSHLKNLGLDIPIDSTLILTNCSSLPEGYKYYNIAEDQTDFGKPWMELYNFSPNTLMKLDKKMFDRLSLSPIEELFYQNELTTDAETDQLKLKKKIVSEVEVYVFTKKKGVR